MHLDRPRTNVTRRLARRGAHLLCAALVATTAAGCIADGGQQSTPAGALVGTHDATNPAAHLVLPSTRPAAATTESTPTTRSPSVLTVRSNEELPIYEHPDDEAPPTQVLPPRTGFGSPLALLVVDTAPGDDPDDPDERWLQVLLPGRPNGHTGWVDSDDVSARFLQHTVEVDLTARVLTVRQGEQPVLSTAVAIGDPTHPTPPGRYSITDKIATDDPDGMYGPYAFGLSGRSEVLTDFAGGDGQIGIHGTNDPSSIGRAVSHGCVRVPNDVARLLNELLLLGTPVTIR